MSHARFRRVAPLLLFMASAAWAAPNGVLGSDQRRSYIGFLELKWLFPEEGALPPPNAKTPKALKIREKPAASSRVLAEIRQPENLMFQEIRMEHSAAIVYAKAGDWYEVAAKSPSLSGWVNSTESQGQFLKLEDFLRSSPASIADEKWDCRLFKSPNSPEAVSWGCNLKVLGALELLTYRQPPGLGERLGREPVHAKPDDRSSIIGEWTPRMTTELKRIDGGCPCGILVLERRGDWLNVALDSPGKDGEEPARVGWIRPKTSEILIQPIASDVILERAEKVLGIRNAYRRKEVRVAAVQWVGPELWAEIEILRGNSCEGGPETGSQQPMTKGWVKVFTEQGSLRIRIATRGC